MISLPQAAILAQHSLPARDLSSGYEDEAVPLEGELHDSALNPFAGGALIGVPFGSGFAQGPELSHDLKVALGSDSA